MKSSFLVFLTAAAMSMGSPVSHVKRDTDITTVHLDQCTGTPQHWSQGILYGMTGNNTPPQFYINDIGVNYESAGGAQVDAQPAGYASSMASYDRRFASLVEAYQRIKAANGVLIVKFADLWGADETTKSDFLWPGDNGDWTKYDAFLQQVFSDLRSNGMANAYSTQLEVWNEPDINFGGRPQSQFNEMWVRTVKAMRAEYGSNSGTFLPIVGPSTAGRPLSNSWWDDFLSYLQQNGGTSVQPDVWNWHLEEGNNNDPIPPAQNLPGYVQGYGLTTGLGLQNNEFGTRPQQVPSYNAWFKARYERLKFNA